MPGQWEYQIGPVGPLEVGDQVHLSRYLLHLLGEKFGIVATFNPKPVKGDWNGKPWLQYKVWSKNPCSNSVLDNSSDMWLVGKPVYW